MSHRATVFSLTLAAAVWLWAAMVPAATIYVSKTGDGTNGNSWATAYNTVTAAVNAAATDDEIWIATGTYAEAAVLSPTVALQVYGGFVGTEPSGYDKSLRQVFTNPTTITVTTDRVVYLDASGTGEVYKNFVWDGVVIAGGRPALGLPGAGMYLTCTSATVLLNQCRFYDNRVTMAPPSGGSGTSGGALWANTAGTSLHITNCEFTSNSMMITYPYTTGSPGAYGVGAYVGNNLTTLTITSCFFADNYAHGISPGASNLRVGGGGMTIAKNNLMVSGCRFERNTVFGGTTTNSGFGGACQVQGASVIFDRCWFVNNTVWPQSGTGGWGGAIWGPQSGAIRCINCYFTGNVTRTANNGQVLGMSNWGNGNWNLRHCTFDRNGTGGRLLANQGNTANMHYITNCIFANYSGQTAVYATANTQAFTINQTLHDGSGTASGGATGYSITYNPTPLGAPFVNNQLQLTAGDPHLPNNLTPGGGPAIDLCPPVVPAVGDIDTVLTSTEVRPLGTGGNVDAGCDEYGWVPVALSAFSVE